MKSTFTDHSLTYRPYLGCMALAFAALAAYVVWVWSQAAALGRFPVIDTGIQLAILFYLISFIRTKVTYQLLDDGIAMTKRGLIRTETLHLPYERISGVHHFKNQLMKPMTYRYTHRMYASLDNRPIWSMVYQIDDGSGKVGRVLMKGSEAFWQAFEDKLPGRIRVSQEEVIANTYKYMENVLRQKGYFQEEPEMDVQEGIEQLRHGEAEKEATPSGKKDN